MEKYMTFSVRIKKECDNNETITCKLEFKKILIIPHLEFLIV